MDTHQPKAGLAAMSPDSTTNQKSDFVHLNQPKQAGTFNDEPGSSMKFARVVEDPELDEVMAFVHMGRKDIEKHLANSALSSRLCTKLKGQNEETRSRILVLEAQRHKLLYSFCNIFYVANPYLGRLPGVEYEAFVEAAKKNLNINVETAAMPVDDKRIETSGVQRKTAKTSTSSSTVKPTLTRNRSTQAILVFPEPRGVVSTSDKNEIQKVQETNSPSNSEIDGKKETQEVKQTQTRDIVNTDSNVKPNLERNTSTQAISVFPEPRDVVSTSDNKDSQKVHETNSPNDGNKETQEVKLTQTLDIENVSESDTPVEQPEKTVNLTEIKRGGDIDQVLQRMSDISGKPTHKSNSFNNLNVEKLLLLDLLSLDAKARDAYIVQSAFELKLLIADGISNQLKLSPRVNLMCLERFNPEQVVESANVRTGSHMARSQYESSDDYIIESEVILPPLDVQATAKPLPTQTLSKKAAKLQAKLDKKALRAAQERENQLRITASKCALKKGQEARLDGIVNGLQKTHLDNVGIARKRGPRSNTISCSSDVSPPSTSEEDHSMAYRSSILKSLRAIQDTVDFQGTARLGMQTQPKLYAKFMAKFNYTVSRIQQKLQANPINRPTAVEKVKPAVVAKLKPVANVLTFSNAVNRLITLHDSSSSIRMVPVVLAQNAYSQWQELPENLVNLDKVIADLLDKKVGKLVVGDLRINAFNITQCYITALSSSSTKEEITKDTLVESILLRQCAMHGDLVEAFVFYSTPSTENRNNPLGFVVRIKEKRNERMVIGHLSVNKNQDFVLFKPITKRVGDLQIDKAHHAATSPDIEINDQMMYMAKVIAWKGEIPIGQITQLIGDKNLLDTNNRAILLENKLEVPSFSKSILDTLPNESFEIPAEEYKKREDLTAEYVFTIDPATARDLDDALSVEQLPNGNFKVGVHISDVTYFVPEFSELDEIISEQATSIYLVDAVYHMLPRSLCMTCSLLPGQDKLSFSVFWEITESGEIISTRFARTVMNSCVQLAYSHAQRMIEEPNHSFGPDELPPIRAGFEASIIAEKVRLLHRLAKPLRQKRFDRFCFTINQPKITFQLDPENGEPLSFERYTQVDSNWLIEEFMLLANQSVASRIHDHYPNEAILRNHLPPNLSNIETLADKLQLYGFKVDIKSDNDISEAFCKLMNDPAHSGTVQAVLSDLLMRQIKRAEYFCSTAGSSLGHFALSIPIYTHFTSPIRRYPDIMVHRLLAASLELSNKPARLPEALQMIADRCNAQKYSAKLAGESSTLLYFKYFVQKLGKLQMQAVVVEMVNAEIFEVMLLETGMKFKINLNKHKPALQLKILQNKPLSGTIQFGGAAKRSVRCEVFSEIRVELSLNAAKSLQANIVPPLGN